MVSAEASGADARGGSLISGETWAKYLEKSFNCNGGFLPTCTAVSLCCSRDRGILGCVPSMGLRPKHEQRRSTRRSTALFIILTTLTCALVGVETLTRRRAARAFEEAVAFGGDDINYCTCDGTEASLARAGCCSGSWASQEQCYWYCGCVCTGASDDWYPDKPSSAPTAPPPTAAPTSDALEEATADLHDTSASTEEALEHKQDGAKSEVPRPPSLPDADTIPTDDSHGPSTDADTTEENVAEDADVAAPEHETKAEADAAAPEEETGPIYDDDGKSAATEEALEHKQDGAKSEVPRPPSLPDADTIPSDDAHEVT